MEQTFTSPDMDSETGTNTGSAGQALGRLVDSAVLLTLLAIFAYFLVYHMEKGYCDYFSIPHELIVIDAPQYMELYPHLMYIFAIFGVLYMSAIAARGIRAKKHPVTLQIVYWSVILYWSLRSAITSGSWWIFSIVAACALALEIVLPLIRPYRTKGTTLFFVPIPDDFGSMGIGAKTGFILIMSPLVLNWTVTIGHTLGDTTARHRTSFSVIEPIDTERESIVLARYGDYFAIVEIDSASQVCSKVRVLQVGDVSANGRSLSRRVIAELKVRGNADDRVEADERSSPEPEFNDTTEVGDSLLIR